MIWKSQIDDRIEEATDLELVRGADGWMTHHLKLLRTELEGIENAKNKRKN